MTQETQQQASYAGTEEHHQQHCPDPTKPFTNYVINAEVARKQADLYADDVKVVQPRYDNLKGAQAKYSDAIKAQKTAFDQLKERLKRIKENLHCVLTDRERDELITCWRELLTQTRPPYDSVDCRPIDGQDLGRLPEDRPALTELLDTAVKCMNRADQRFDRLIKLPADLPTVISELAERATTLEQAVCTAAKELMRRHYVEYLELHRDFEALEADWIDPTEYGCRLKRYFRALLRRHVLVIAVHVAIERLDQYDKREEAEKEEKKANLIDFVLACAAPDPKSPGGHSPSVQSEQPAQESVPAPAPAPAARPVQESPAPDVEEV